jgi:glycosyltransferase involved in cell wall biosynthesis
MGKKNVYFFNRIKGFYRGQYSLKYFKDKFLQYNTIYIDDDFFSNGQHGFTGKLFSRILNILYKHLSVTRTDMVWIPAMAYAKTKEWDLIRNSKAKVVFDFYVSQYENLTNEFKTVNPDSESGIQLRSTEIEFLKRADITFFLTSAERAYFLEFLGIQPKEIKSEILPLVVDRRPKAKLPFARRRTSRPVLAWWGTNLPLHGLKNLINGLHLLKKSGIDFQFYLIVNNETRGADNDSLYAMVHELGLDEEVVYKHQFSLHDFSLEDFLIKEVDLALGSFGGTKKGQTVLMNKVADAVSMSLPCLTEYSSGLSEFLEPGKDIFCCEPNPDDIARNLEMILKSPERMLELASGLEAKYEGIFSPNAFYKKLNSVLQEL